MAALLVAAVIVSALEDLDDPQPDMRSASERERHLFDEHLSRNAGFSPLDRSATLPALSSIRDAGNTAAHEGSADSAIVLELHNTLLPQVLASLSNAVTHRRP